MVISHPTSQSQDNRYCQLAKARQAFTAAAEMPLLEAEVRTINVHALGPSGSGKTVFMAAMYRQLRIKRGDADFYLKTDHATSVHMNSVFNAVANPQEEWPASTRVASEWEFGLTVRTPAGEFEPLKMRYLDYPGLILTAPRAAEDERYQQVIEQLRSAHALLVLLDGAGVRACLRGEPQGRRFLNFELSSSLEIVQQTRCPVHFAVTKWDLLEGAHTLKEVRDLLLGDDNFRDLIRGRFESPAGPVRLIPVSSVGTGFAAMQPNGQMHKLGQPARPFQVELPFLSVIPDFFTYACAELQTKDRDLLNRVQRHLRNAETDEHPGRNAGRLAATRELTRRVLASRLAKSLKESNPVLAALLHDQDQLADGLFLVAQEISRRAAALTGRRRAADAAAVASLRESVHDQISALQLIETQFHEILGRFEQNCPESLLAGPQVAGSGYEDIDQGVPGDMPAMPSFGGMR